MITLHAVPEGDLPARSTPWSMRLYLAAWGLLAGCALVYLILVVARPQLASTLIGPTKFSGSATDSTALDGVRHDVGALRSEVAVLRADSVSGEVRDRALAMRVTQLEAAVSKIPETADTTQAPPRSTDTPLTTASTSALPEKPTSLSGTLVQGKVEDKPAKSAPRPAVAVVQPAPPPAATDQARPSTPPAAVRIASGPSLDALRLSWQLLVEGHRPILKPLEPRWMSVAGDPGSFALLAGPVASSEEAAKICASLKAKRITCSVTRFGGQPL